MSLALVRKTLRDSRLLLILLPLAAALFEIMFLRALMEFTADNSIRFWLDKPMAQRFTRVLLGADLLGEINSTALATLGFAHPLLYALSWTLVISLATRVVAGEIDRGTADLLLTLPMSRTGIYSNVSLVCLSTGIPMCLAPLVGDWIGDKFFKLGEPLDMWRLSLLSVNLFALYLAIGGMTLLISTIVSRRGPAVAIAMGVILFSFLLSALAQFSETINQISFLGLLNYYRPLPIIRSGRLPLADIATLTAIGAFCWTAGLWHFRRRDIPAA